MILDGRELTHCLSPTKVSIEVLRLVFYDKLAVGIVESSPLIIPAQSDSCRNMYYDREVGVSRGT